MKKAKAPKKEVSKDEEITNPFYGIPFDEAVKKAVTTAKPKKEKK